MGQEQPIPDIETVHLRCQAALQYLVERRYPAIIFNQRNGACSYTLPRDTWPPDFRCGPDETLFELGAPFGYQLALDAICTFAKRAAVELHAIGGPIEDWRALFAVGPRKTFYSKWEDAVAATPWISVLATQGAS